MKRTTTAILTGLTALVLAGSGLGVAAAVDHPTSTTHTPATTVQTATRPTPAAAHHARPEHRAQQQRTEAEHRTQSPQRTQSQHHATVYRATSSRTGSTQHHGDDADHGFCDGRGCDHSSNNRDQSPGAHRATGRSPLALAGHPTLR